MNSAALAGKAPATHIRLGARETTAIEGCRGLSICCLEGLVWVTREGDVRDYILPPGLRFVAADAGRVVINGMAEDNRVEIGAAPPAGARINACQPLQIDWAHVARIGQLARRARAEYVAAAWHRAFERIARLWRAWHGIPRQTHHNP